MYLLNTKKHPSHFLFFVNSIKSIIYIYNTKLEKITMYHSASFGSTQINVQEIKGGNNPSDKLIVSNLEEALKEKNDFLTVVDVIASTTKVQGFFNQENEDSGLTTSYLNIYLNAKVFLEAKSNNKYEVSFKNPILKILKDNCPTIEIILRNLMYEEDDAIVINFLNWLSVIAYKDTHQDIIWLFKGLDYENGLEGQGAGKGVIRTLFSKMFSKLIGEVSNGNYDSNFNSRLAHKKIVIFDEVDFKKLQYNTLKDISGNPNLSIENKGKESLVIQNVSSWILFTNESDLRGKVSMDDRRMVICCPNPETGSLKRLQIIPNFNSDYKSFENKLLSEIDNFIHVLALVPGKVKNPIELRTKAHKDLWNVKATLLDIKEFIDIFLINTKQELFIEFLKELVSIGEMDRKEYMILKYHFEHSFYYHEIFVNIFAICKEHNLVNITKSTKPFSKLQDLKSKIIRKGYEVFEINTGKGESRIVHKNSYKKVIPMPNGKGNQTLGSEQNKAYKKRMIAFLKYNIENRSNENTNLPSNNEDNIPF